MDKMLIVSHLFVHSMTQTLRLQTVLPAIALLCFGLFACQSTLSEQPDGKPVTLAFFDLKGYMAEQIKDLKARQPKVNKQVSINGKNETLHLDSIDFEEELAIFTNSDINRPAWSDQYSKDSTFVSGQLSELRYVAQKENLKTQLLHVFFSEGVVQKIELKNQSSAAIVSAEETMTYTPNEGYSILYKESPLLAKPKNFSVEAVFE